MNSKFNETLSRYLSRLKGSDFVIDSRIKATSLLRLVVGRSIMRARGKLRFPGRRPSPYIAGGAVIRWGAQLEFGRGVTFGPDSFVDALSVDGVQIGHNSSLGRNSRIECTGSLQTLGKGIQIGDNVGLGADCFYGCAGGIVIGNDTIIGNYVSFHSENHSIADRDVPIRLQGVEHAGITVGENCWLGAKVTVLDGATIGSGCVIAAGSVVTAGDYPDNGIYGGVPARHLRSRM